ncbi:hypothetical protein H920_06006 [Fukomys damarensis]|uniref:Uncharacterized protein n=1 Tax=Fukomys damarensis TaxID=885580 RepID=A0A091DQQ1_FUKDA|nr:hypothetical protein H920_06006 [Fukomys damarensis]
MPQRGEGLWGSSSPLPSSEFLLERKGHSRAAPSLRAPVTRYRLNSGTALQSGSALLTERGQSLREYHRLAGVTAGLLHLELEDLEIGNLGREKSGKESTGCGTEHGGVDRKGKGPGPQSEALDFGGPGSQVSEVLPVSPTASEGGDLQSPSKGL